MRGVATPEAVVFAIFILRPASADAAEAFALDAAATTGVLAPDADPDPLAIAVEVLGRLRIGSVGVAAFAELVFCSIDIVCVVVLTSD